MGMGKTLQAVSLIVTHPRDGVILGPDADAPSAAASHAKPPAAPVLRLRVSGALPQAANGDKGAPTSGGSVAGADENAGGASNAADEAVVKEAQQLNTALETEAADAQKAAAETAAGLLTPQQDRARARASLGEEDDFDEARDKATVAQSPAGAEKADIRQAGEAAGAVHDAAEAPDGVEGAAEAASKAKGAKGKARSTAKSRKAAAATAAKAAAEAAAAAAASAAATPDGATGKNKGKGKAAAKAPKAPKTKTPKAKKPRVDPLCAAMEQAKTCHAEEEDCGVEGFCKATLVVCPVVAAMQWRQEIARYTAPGVLCSAAARCKLALVRSPHPCNTCHLVAARTVLVLAAHATDCAPRTEHIAQPDTWWRCAAGSVKVVLYHGTNRSEEFCQAELKDADVVLTTYSILEVDFRKNLMAPKAACEFCGKKFQPERLKVHLRCGRPWQLLALLYHWY
jgi:SNF2-related domain